jgi:hypothetical protein
MGFGSWIANLAIKRGIGMGERSRVADRFCWGEERRQKCWEMAGSWGLGLSGVGGKRKGKGMRGLTAL